MVSFFTSLCCCCPQSAISENADDASVVHDFSEPIDQKDPNSDRVQRAVEDLIGPTVDASVDRSMSGLGAGAMALAHMVTPSIVHPVVDELVEFSTETSTGPVQRAARRVTTAGSVALGNRVTGGVESSGRSLYTRFFG